MNNEPRSLGDQLPGVVEHLVNEADADMPRFEVVRTGDRTPIPRVVRLLVWRRDNGQCQLCSTRRGKMHLDHIVPWSAGGPDTSDNLRVLCGDCNQRRSNHRLAEPVPSEPVVMCCDECLTVLHHHVPGGRCRYWPLCPTCGTTGEVAGAYCGTCRSHDAPADTRRFL